MYIHSTRSILVLPDPRRGAQVYHSIIIKPIGPCPFRYLYHKSMYLSYIHNVALSYSLEYKKLFCALCYFGHVSSLNLGT